MLYNFAWNCDVKSYKILSQDSNINPVNNNINQIFGKVIESSKYFILFNLFEEAMNKLLGSFHNKIQDKLSYVLPYVSTEKAVSLNVKTFGQDITEYFKPKVNHKTCFGLKEVQKKLDNFRSIR